MSFWTAVVVIVIVTTAGKLVSNLIKGLTGSHGPGKDSTSRREIDHLRDKVKELEHIIENDVDHRIQNIELIVADKDFALNYEIKKALENKNEDEEE
ncbi:MAG: hypothetical protein GY866_06480 [Proteobacteria bacterium]|nr:hypothetical protein [Pseudomonadota bacterium]